MGAYVQCTQQRLLSLQISMSAIALTAEILMGFWGVAHLGFGAGVLGPAMKNDLGGVFMLLLDGHPHPTALQESVSHKFILGPHSLMRQHGMNLLIIGGFAVYTAVYLMTNSQHHFTAFVMCCLIFCDHHAYGISVDMAGYNGPAGKLMLYVVNVSILLFTLTIQKEGVISGLTAHIMMSLNVLMMIIATVKTIMNKRNPPKLDDMQCLLA